MYSSPAGQEVSLLIHSVFETELQTALCLEQQLRLFPFLYNKVKNLYNKNFQVHTQLS